MQLELDTRLRRLARRLPPVTIFRAGELALMLLVAALAARLLWAVVTPVTPLGNWADGRGAGQAVPALLTFDPFFRGAAQSGPVVVTSLQLVLFGIRQNEASGGGSAIVEVPGQGQQSYNVGAEIQSGVVLKAVAFDHIVITRGGVDEQLFLDQSAGAETPATGISATSVRPASAASLASAFTVAARTEGQQATGVVVQPAGDGEAFRSAGLQPGDILVMVNGEGVRSAEDVALKLADLPAGESSTLVVERGGQRVTLNPVVKQ